MASPIQALYDDLKARKDRHEAETQALQARADALRDQIAPLEGELRGLKAQLRAAREASGYDEVVRELAKLQRVIEDASGAGPKRVTLKAEGSDTSAAPGEVG